MRKAPVAVRLRDIAEQAGVSVNTVSRALTGKPDINAETRDRVRALAARLGYMPNMLARSLLRGNTRTIGLVVTDCTDPFYASLIRAVENTLSQDSFGLLLATSNENVGKERQALAMLRERRVDGLLLTPVDVAADHVRELLAAELPIVLLGRRPAGYEGPFVGTNNIAGAGLIVGHLIALGHQRIAHLSRSDKASSAQERLSGYRMALAEAGIPAPGSLVHRVAPTVEGGKRGAEWLAAMRPRPTALFAYNDSQAVGAMIALNDAGLAVPGECSVAGFDNIELSELVRPALTTVAQPIEDIGRRGAQMLIDRLERDVAGGAMLLPPRLMLRQSTAAPGPPQRARSLGRKREISGT
jgi:LacI family transcriptional regulator, galactose operon repressor